MAKAEKMTRMGKVSGRTNCTVCNGSRVLVTGSYVIGPKGALRQKIERIPCPNCTAPTQ